jgi:hypothetical protein
VIILGVVRPGMGCRAGLEKKDVEPALWCVMIRPRQKQGTANVQRERSS